MTLLERAWRRVGPPAPGGGDEAPPLPLPLPPSPPAPLGVVVLVVHPFFSDPLPYNSRYSAMREA